MKYTHLNNKILTQLNITNNKAQLFRLKYTIKKVNFQKGEIRK